MSAEEHGYRPESALAGSILRASTRLEAMVIFSCAKDRITAEVLLPSWIAVDEGASASASIGILKYGRSMDRDKLLAGLVERCVETLANRVPVVASLLQPRSPHTRG